MSSLFEQISSLKGFPIKQAKAELKRIQALSADEFCEWQKNMSWEIAKFHYDNNALYKKLVGNHFPDKWEDLPIVTKQDLQQPLDSLLSNGIRLSDSYKGSTSGSTGTPFFFAKDKYAHAMTWAVIADRYSWYDIDFSDKQARFYGMPHEFAARYTEKLKDRLMNRERFSVFDLSDTALNTFINRFANNRFTYLYGYTSALVMFARHLIKKELALNDICKSIKVCICTSETCTEEDKAIMSKGFGVPIIREYGLSETCLTAFDNPNSDWQLTEETLFTEEVDGRIVSTSLYNKALPMVRYQTGDLGEIVTVNNSKYRKLDRLTGRTNDTVHLPSGKTAAGLVFYYISRSVLENTGALKEFIIRQTKSNQFVFDIVSDRELTETEQELVKEKCNLYLEPGLDIVINKVDEISRPASGKLKHFYSELN
ncbi:MAG: phenylacetate--CoA ligase family protein [Chitinophagales bacterium]|nr:hypothetical protein [Chitinophagaceae bacterium]MCB9065397.1 phenylacetate--CoA ligase family protein [Chitinophagales bacterium]